MTASEGKKKRKCASAAEAECVIQWRPLQSKTKYIQSETLPVDMPPRRFNHGSGRHCITYLAPGKKTLICVFFSVADLGAGDAVGQEP